ncbi:MAG: glycoside hydrolase family 38 N-terminal domain-containing protein [Planctomycetota bacterium]|jgi:alpha-mannosidase
MFKHRRIGAGISLAAMLLSLRALPVPAATADTPSVRGYVIPLIHQDVGYTDTAQITLNKMADCLVNVVPLLEKNPDWCFWWENVYTLKYALTKHPDLKPRVRALLSSGQLGVGAEWIGVDAGLVPSESLVRTITLAKSWMMQNLGYEPTIASMNDMAGFAPQMAQVFAKAGVRFFFYTRGWEPPNSNYFYNVGLDGSKVLATKVTAPKEYRGSEDVGYDGFYLFSGLGAILDGVYKWDPTPQELEKVMADLVRVNRAIDPTEWPGRIFWGMLNGGGDNRCPDLPTVNSMIEKWNQSTHPEIEKVDFEFGSLDKIARELLTEAPEANPQNWIIYMQPWPVQCRQERAFYYVSKAEANLLAAEKLASLCEILGLGKYPAEDFDHIWGEKLLWIYDHNWGGRGGSGGSDFEKLRSAREAAGLSQAILASQARTLASAIRFSREHPITVFNTLNWPRTDIVEATVDLPTGRYKVIDAAGREMSCAVSISGANPFAGHWEYEIRFKAENVPSFGYKTFYLVQDNPGRPLDVEEDGIENKFFEIELDKRRGIKSIFSKKLGKELIRQGGSMKFAEIVAEDVTNRPKGELDADPALDATAVVTDKLEIQSVETHRKDDLGLEAVIRGQIEDSPVTLTLNLWHGIERVDLKVEIDYSGTAPRLLYMPLPFNMDKGWKNTIGIAFGAMDNPVLQGDNNSPERSIEGGLSKRSSFAKAHIGSGWTDPTAARFAQKWTSLTSPDGKWGLTIALKHNHTPIYRTAEGIYMGLLRSLTKHDADTKKAGYHSCELSFVPHSGPGDNAKAARIGWQTSSELTTVAIPDSIRLSREGRLPETAAFLETDAQNIIVTSLTKSRNAGYTLRYYEAADKDDPTRINFRSGLTCTAAAQTDLMGATTKPLPLKDNTLTVETVGYEIKTLQLEIAPPSK